MADVLDLENKLVRVSAKVATDTARADTATADRVAAEAASLVRLVESIKPDLPFICDRLPDGISKLHGVQLAQGKLETMFFGDGTFEGNSEALVRNFNLRTVLERVVQVSNRGPATDKPDRRTAKIRPILELLAS